MSGPDAESYLQGQLTQDVQTLAAEPRWSLLLSPDSVIDGIVTVCRDENGFVLATEAALVELVEARLRRFMLRTQCVLDPIGSVKSAFTSEHERIQRHWPGAGEVMARLTPHSLGRRVVSETISFTKGCFTGQELVGRLDARGANVPWRLYYFSADNSAAVHEWICSIGPSGPQGVTSQVWNRGGVEGLAVGHRSLLSSLPPDGVLCTQVE